MSLLLSSSSTADPHNPFSRISSFYILQLAASHDFSSPIACIRFFLQRILGVFCLLLLSITTACSYKWLYIQNVQGTLMYVGSSQCWPREFSLVGRNLIWRSSIGAWRAQRQLRLCYCAPSVLTHCSQGLVCYFQWNAPDSNKSRGSLLHLNSESI